MSLLAHATYAAPGFEAEKRDLATQAQLVIQQAKKIQMLTRCGWTEALCAAEGNPAPAPNNSHVAQ